MIREIGFRCDLKRRAMSQHGIGLHRVASSFHDVIIACYSIRLWKIRSAEEASGTNREGIKLCAYRPRNGGICGLSLIRARSHLRITARRLGRHTKCTRANYPPCNASAASLTTETQGPVYYIRSTFTRAPFKFHPDFVCRALYLRRLSPTVSCDQSTLPCFVSFRKKVARFHLFLKASAS